MKNSENKTDIGLKETLINHFDDQTSNLNTHSHLDNYGSKTNDKFLRSPYEYLEERLINSDIKGKKILDYCCGTAVYSVFPALSGAIVSGNDISPESISLANERSKKMGLSDKCFFDVCDAEDLHYESESFDIAMSLGSLTYLNLDTAFFQLHKVLKPKGTLIVIDSLGHNPLFNANRKKNIDNYAFGEYQHLRSKKINELETSSAPYFDLVEAKFFDLITTFGFFLKKQFKIEVRSSLLRRMDEVILSNRFIGKYSFKGFFVFEVKNKKTC